jgi:DNA modification methylase
MNNIILYNNDFRNCLIPKGLIITDPPYNQNYKYSSYKDKVSEEDYIELLSKIPLPAVIITYPETAINILPLAFKSKCQEVVSWIYNSNTGKQHRLITWWGCKPDFKKLTQKYKNINDKRIKELLNKGRTGAKLYDWWYIDQVKNVSKEKTLHPCQIPEEIIRRIIMLTANKGDTIIDVFAGSGTTNKVAIELGYDTIAYEIDGDYCKIINDRNTGNILNNNE